VVLVELRHQLRTNSRRNVHFDHKNDATTNHHRHSTMTEDADIATLLRRVIVTTLHLRWLDMTVTVAVNFSGHRCRRLLKAALAVMANIATTGQSSHNRGGAIEGMKTRDVLHHHAIATDKVTGARDRRCSNEVAEHRQRFSGRCNCNSRCSQCERSR